MKTTNPYFGPLTLLSGVLIFSTNGFWQAIAPEGVTPYVVGAARLLIGGVALWLYQLFFFQGVHFIGVAVGTVIAVGSAPIFTLTEKVSPAKLEVIPANLQMPF